MRPDILNPLFAEVEVLKGVGPQIAKLLRRLDLTRIVDVLYHLPTGAIERIKAPAASAMLLGRNVIIEVTPFEARESRSGRGPTRIFASDGDGNKCVDSGWKHKAQPRIENSIATIYSALGIDWSKEVRGLPSGRTYTYVDPLGANGIIPTDEFSHIYG